MGDGPVLIPGFIGGFIGGAPFNAVFAAPASAAHFGCLAAGDIEPAIEPAPIPIAAGGAPPNAPTALPRFFIKAITSFLSFS
jgi:hypothetical protein